MADCMSYVLHLCLTEEVDPEEEGYEFSKYILKENSHQTRCGKAKMLPL